MQLKNIKNYFVLLITFISMLFLTGCHHHETVNLQQIAKKLQTDRAYLHLTSISKNTYLVKQVFPADGQYHYFIVTARGQLTPVSYWLPKTTHNDLLIYSKLPVLQKEKDGSTKLLFTIEARPCVACESLQTFDLTLRFNQQGELIHHTVN